MKRFICFLMLLAAVSGSSCRSGNSMPEVPDTYNLDFEILTGGAPAGWGQKDGNYIYTVDSVTHKNGKYAAVLEYHGDEPDFGSLSIVIPCNFEGKRITLSGYIKTENVEGYAGLWMRLGPGVSFDNMQNREIKGTTDWTRYEISLPLQPDKTEQIVLGALLAGKGKIWVDGLRVQIDGKDIAQAAQRPESPFAADADTEFAERSGVTEAMLERFTAEDLTNLGLVWGYLKYYHPAIQRGDRNWDVELFRLIPRLSAAAPADRDGLLAAWIDALGAYDQSESRFDPRNVKLQPDLRWISGSGFSKDLTGRLLRVQTAVREPKGYYIDFAEGVGNPLFLHEHNPNGVYPDAGYRLLAVYRFWNMVQYFYPNRHLIGEDWPGVLRRCVPQVVSAADEQGYVFAMLGLINSLNDTHADLYAYSQPFAEWLGTRQAAEKVSFVGEKAVVTGYYGDSLGMRSPLRPGDVLLLLDGRPTEQIVRERLDYSPASNRPTKLRKIAQNLMRSNAPRIEVTYLRGGKAATEAVETYSVRDIPFSSGPDTCFRMVNDKAAYLHMGTLKSADLQNLFSAIRKADGLIVDLRCYPNEFSSIYVLGAFLIPTPTPFFMASKGSALWPGVFSLEEGNKIGGYNLNPYKGKVVVLVNEDTQSMAEFAAMAFGAGPNTTVVGSTTAGADGDVSFIDLPGEMRTCISGIGIYYPDGRETQRIGIVPDIEAVPTVAGIAAGRDEVLERAVALIVSGR